MLCHGLEEVHQHLLGNVLAEQQSLQNGMVIVESCVNASVLYLFFKVFRAVECVHVRRVKDGAADSEVHVRSRKIAL